MSDIQIHKEMTPEPVLRRLPWYLAYVTELKAERIEYVSSTRIAEDLDLDSSQIAKDLSYLNIKGKTRIGYEVAQLVETLEHFLGFRLKHNAVIIGVGSLGGALIQDSGLDSYGLNIVAGFDIRSEIIDRQIGDIKIYHIDQLKTIIEEMDVKVGIITVPFESAQRVAEICMGAGLKGLWNFTPCRIRVHDGVVIQNTSIYSNLAVMYNRLGTIQ